MKIFLADPFFFLSETRDDRRGRATSASYVRATSRSHIDPTMANDGGIVLALLLLIAALCAVFYSSIALYASAPTKEPASFPARLARLLSGWANVGNAVTHGLLIVVLLTDKGRYGAYFPDEVNSYAAGPVCLGLINGLIGFFSLRGGSLKVSLGWNTFVALAGSLVPMVWPKFIDVGMTTWPYVTVFLWFAIYAFESTAFFFSAAGVALKDAPGAKAK